ncbi:MAG: hypothetical protein IKR96_00280 [Bacteroidales bacterium]|nr:hypothetical protein [Bacteroidales bacterium]
MMRAVQIIVTGILMSLFYFPFEFTFLPGINTKMLLAVVGLGLMGLSFARRRAFSISRDMLILVLIACCVSIVAYFSQTIHHTPDDTYVTYIVSFLTWFCAAFTVCSCIKAVHGRIDVVLIVHYLAVVAVCQCAVTMWISYDPAFQRFVDSYVAQDQTLLHELDRLYGIGSSLDVAGLRYALILVALGAVLGSGRLSAGWTYFDIGAFLVITVIGNMVARTALVGTAVGLGWIVISAFLPGEKRRTSLLPWLLFILVVSIACTLLYQFNPQFRYLFRFAFEGFFSLVEKGEWQIDSTDRLATMVVYPETLHTWILGDGYFENSRNDINYLGDATDQGFYMGTDIGYLRFIFYFGVPGMLLMVAVIAWSALICIRRFPEDKIVFLLALAVGLTVWFKVSTDTFLFFALFLSAGILQEEDEPEQPALENP